MSLPYHGPVLMATAAEAQRIWELLQQRPVLTRLEDGLLAKCLAVLNADPRWKQPTR